MARVTVLYRLANQPAAQPKEKLPEASKWACLANCIDVFGVDAVTVFGDRLDAGTRAMVCGFGVRLVDVDEGSGGGNFRAAACAAMQLSDAAKVYLLEDDFLHRPGALEALLDGLSLGAEYVTLYDHPDKYLSPAEGGNPSVKHGGEATRLFCGKVCHWKETESTVMTFATTAGQLRADWKTFLRYCGGRYTDDYRLFRRLRFWGRRLISAVPGYATHCESRWLSPFTDWVAIGRAADGRAVGAGGALA